MFQDQSLGILCMTSLFTHFISHSQQLIYYNQFNQMIEKYGQIQYNNIMEGDIVYTYKNWRCDLSLWSSIYYCIKPTKRIPL